MEFEAKNKADLKKAKPALEHITKSINGLVFDLDIESNAPALRVPYGELTVDLIKVS